MKVLHIGKYYPPYFGGIEKVNFDCVEQLNREGIETDVLCFNHKKGNLLENRSYKIHRCSTLFTLFSTPFSVSLFFKLRKIKKDYDILHLHLPNPMVVLAVLIVGFKGKIVLHWHSDIVNQSKLKKIIGPLETRIKQRADQIITTSQNYLEASEDLKKYLDKCTVIPIGIDHQEFKENLPFRKQLEEKYQDKKVVFSLGRLIYYKGFQYLIEAAKCLDENTIILVGGVGILQESLVKQINDLNLSEKVILLGSIPFEELGEYYKHCDIFCLPSVERSEAFGVVLIEAMSYGCPLVTTTILGSGVPWVNAHGISGINVPPKKPDLLAEALTTILTDSKLAHDLARGAENRYNELFTLQKMGQSLQKLYENL